MNIEPDVVGAGVRGGVAVSGASIAALSPNEMASMAAALLTCIYVIAQLVTLTPRLLDSLRELSRRWAAPKEAGCQSKQSEDASQPPE